MSDLKKQLIKLGSTHPELRPHIREVLSSLPSERDVQNHPLLKSAKNVILGNLKEINHALEGKTRLGRLSEEDTALYLELEKRLSNALLALPKRN